MTVSGFVGYLGLDSLVFGYSRHLKAKERKIMNDVKTKSTKSFVTCLHISSVLLTQLFYLLYCFAQLDNLQRGIGVFPSYHSPDFGNLESFSPERLV